jgi:hypothetical protein
VVKVWLLGSYLATLACVAGVPGEPDRDDYAVAAIRQWRLTVKPPIELIIIPLIQTSARDAIHNSGAKRMLPLRRQLIAHKPQIIVDWLRCRGGSNHSRKALT